jgi:hypothetical protein
MEDDTCFPRGLAGSELLAEIVSEIDLRSIEDEDTVLFVMLASAWPTAHAQHH